jgi:GxxExxY protein
MKKRKVDLLYKDITYKIRGAVFAVHKTLGLGHKESVYHKALALEFKKWGLSFTEEKVIPVIYEGINVGVYKPDFIVEDKILIEIKAVPFIVRNHVEQMRHYLSSTNYKLGLLVNFGARRAQIKRIIYDKAKN